VCATTARQVQLLQACAHVPSTCLAACCSQHLDLWVPMQAILHQLTLRPGGGGSFRSENLNTLWPALISCGKYIRYTVTAPRNAPISSPAAAGSDTGGQVKACV
jgi:hypothetical protein